MIRITAALALGALSSLGCGGSEVTCGDPPPQPIHAFLVTTITGHEPTDMNIHFCYQRKSSPSFACENLDTAGNNFERDQTDSFKVPVAPPIEEGDLQTFMVKNTGGGFFENSWDMKALTVEAQLADGQRHLLYEEVWDSSINLSRNETFIQESCGY